MNVLVSLLALSVSLSVLSIPVLIAQSLKSKQHSQIHLYLTLTKALEVQERQTEILISTFQTSMNHLAAKTVEEYANLKLIDQGIPSVVQPFAEEEIQYRTVYDMANEAEDLGIELDE